jgi:hypothetical protein
VLLGCYSVAIANVVVVMLTSLKKLSIMDSFPLSAYTALVDYEIWIGFNFLQGKYNSHTSRKNVVAE